MKRWTIILAALTGLGATAALAAAEDADGNGVYSMEELKAAYPEVTEELFAEIDTDGDGAINPEELAAAETAGLLTAG